jgi:hypothetical protein
MVEPPVGAGDVAVAVVEVGADVVRLDTGGVEAGGVEAVVVPLFAVASWVLLVEDLHPALIASEVKATPAAAAVVRLRNCLLVNLVTL